MINFPRLSDEQWHALDLLNRGAESDPDVWCRNAEGKAWPKVEREGRQGICAQGRIRTLWALKAKGLVTYEGAFFQVSTEGREAIEEYHRRIAARKERAAIRIAVAQRKRA